MSSQVQVQVVILAGGRASADAVAAGWPEWRALAPLAGRPTIAWVLDAFRASSTIGDICVVGPGDLREVIGDAKLIPPGKAMWDSVSAGLRSVGHGKALISSADAPLLTPESIDDVVNRSVALDAAFVYPYVSRQDSESQCPGLKRTYGSLAEGVFTGGNLMLVDVDIVLRQEPVIRKALDARKKPFTLARMLSLRILVKALMKRVTVNDLEQRISLILGAKARGLLSMYAVIAADLDDPAEAPVFEQLIRRG